MRRFLIFVLILFFPSQTIFLAVDLNIHVWNGTFSKPGKADTLRVLILKDSMVPVREYKNIEGNFFIQKLEVPESIPILLQAEYKGVNYNKIIPPLPEFRNKEIQLEVYELTNDKKDIQFWSLLQFSKLKEFMQINKIYIVQNKTNPKYSYQSKEGFRIFVPKEALNLNIVWTQPESKMPIPIQWEDQFDNVKKINRSFLPGNTEIQVSYQLPWKDKTLSILDQLFLENESMDNKKPVFIKPKDMRLEVNNADIEELENEIPEGYRAFLVTYLGPNKTAEFTFSGGTPIVSEFFQESRQITNPGYLKDWHTSIAAVIAFISLLFIFQYSMEYFIKK